MVGLYRWQPKATKTAVPAGSVYWFDNFEGDSGKLAAWVANGMAGDNAPNTPRGTEGYDIAWLATWQ